MNESWDEERFDEKDDAPEYIQPKFLKELWFHTGTVCNEGSKPGDNRLNTKLEWIPGQQLTWVA